MNRAISLDLIPTSLELKYKQAITSAEFCAFAVTLYENVKGIEITGRQTFTDTDDTNVEKMAALGVVNGISPGIFAPASSLTREQAATILARLARALGRHFPLQETTFGDKGSISDWALEAVGQVQAAGIMSGVRTDTFSPMGPYTIEQSIITMLRMYDAMK